MCLIAHIYILQVVICLCNALPIYPISTNYNSLLNNDVHSYDVGSFAKNRSHPSIPSLDVSLNENDLKLNLREQSVDRNAALLWEAPRQRKSKVDESALIIIWLELRRRMTLTQSLANRISSKIGLFLNLPPNCVHVQRLLTQSRPGIELYTVSPPDTQHKKELDYAQQQSSLGYTYLPADSVVHILKSKLVELNKLLQPSGVRVTSIRSKMEQNMESSTVHLKASDYRRVQTRKEEVYKIWQLPFVIISSLLLIFMVFIVLMFLFFQQQLAEKLNEAEVHKPPLPNALPSADADSRFDSEGTTVRVLPVIQQHQIGVETTLVQPVIRPLSPSAQLQPVTLLTNQTTTEESQLLESPRRSLKARRLLERRGSNASLTIDLHILTNCGATDIANVEFPTPTLQHRRFLTTATCRLTRPELRDSIEDFRLLHTQFWEIPMNHPSKIDVPGSGLKNRYRTILPNEHTRVVLEELPTDPTSSYINANYVMGFSGEEKSYVACQGPMSNTISDFWRMIWLTRSPIIVMITRLKEENKVKCDSYLPEQRDTFGNVEVTVTKMSIYDGFTVRELRLRNDYETRMVDHFWFTAWPDHKVPHRPNQLLALAVEVERRRALCAHKTITVHCSAGIGRTGCFIATSIGMRQLEMESCVDVLGIVCRLRLDRGGMVQTAEQYEFVHRALCLYERTLPWIQENKS